MKKFPYEDEYGYTEEEREDFEMGEFAPGYGEKPSRYPCFVWFLIGAGIGVVVWFAWLHAYYP